MADPTLDRSKSTKSTASAASNATMLKRWKSLVNPFVARDSCDGCGRGSCDNGFEGQWDNAGVPSVRPRQFSKTGHEGWPRALSNARQPVRKVNHTRFASSQAMSGADGFRITYGASTGSEDNDDTTASSARPSHSRGSQPRGSETVPDEGEIDLDVVDDNDDDDDAMGLATQRRSKRYSSQKSPLSPTFSTFGLKDRDRKSDGRMAKSILKRESIRLSALPPMPKGGGGARRSFPAGHGLATLVSEPQQKPAALNRSYVFPGTDAGVRGSNTPRFVSFNGLLDPARPENRPVLAKMISTVLLLAVTFTITFVSATLTPASLRISRGFETSSEVVILASALTVLGFAFGAPLFGACGEEYGRKRPLLTGLAMFAILNTPLAITENLATLIAFRFFVGVFGAAPLVIVPAILTDLWSPVGRGIALSFFAAVTVIGPVVGAIAGSYLAVVEFPGWRWTSWIAVVLSVFFGLPLTLVFRESSAAVLLQRKAQSLRLVTKDWSFHAEAEENGEGVTSHAIKTALLLAEPSLLLPTIHMSFACGLLNLMFVSYGYAFRTERHWLRGAQDLPLLPLIFGCFVGIFINFIVSKKKYTAVFRRDGFAPPEDRLVPWIIGSWILPIGLLVFAWTSSPEITFVPQIMAGVPSGIGISLILIGGLNYIADTYTAMPTLAIGANTFIRSALAFAFPLFAPRMYENLGVGFANTTLAIIAVVMVPIPILLMKLGPRFRGMGRFALKPQSLQDTSREDVGAEMVQRDDKFSVVIEDRSEKTA